MRADQSILIHVVHGDRLARAGMVGSLSRFAEFDVVEAASATETLLRSEVSGGKQVIVADLASALELRRGVKPSAGRAGPAIVASGPDRERELRQALDSGICGYLVSGFSLEQLADSVRAVHRGLRYLCPRAAARLAESTSFCALTGREEAVLELVAQGLCNKSIARQLDIAVGTVKSHLKSAYSKLVVDSRTQAVVVSERRGLFARHDMAGAPPPHSVHARLPNLLSALH